MATERLSMRRTREILRLKWELGKSHRETARSLGVSVGVVASTMTRAKHAGLTDALVRELDDEALERRLYGEPGTRGRRHRPQPDMAHIDLELRRPGVTLELLHVEYLREHPDGYKYTRFCDLYRTWRNRQGRSMRQVHRAGEKMFVDYSGKKAYVIDRKTGEARPVELFVAVLGASNYTYVEATWTQQSTDWIASHARALEYFGGVPGAIVPDQLKSGVTRSCRYEPQVQRTYREMAEHYGTAVLPARPRKPQDKAKVEVAVQVAQRWILARIRNERFFSLAGLNARIAELLTELNARIMRRYGKSRRELFEALDQPALRPLPSQRYVHGVWKTARVNIDYHIEVERHYYSVPHALVGELVEVRTTWATVEIFYKGKRVASFHRSREVGRHTTQPEHMPKAHQKHLQWTPSRLIRWAAKMGPDTARLVRAILEERIHPEQGYRSCLGILRLEKRYGAERLEAASGRALRGGARSYKHVQAILKRGLDRVPWPDETPSAPAIEHDNVRGPDYYH